MFIGFDLRCEVFDHELTTWVWKGRKKTSNQRWIFSVGSGEKHFQKYQTKLR